MTKYDVDYVDDGNWEDPDDWEENDDREAARQHNAENEHLPRLQKALAHAGVASRRACESLITSGRVTVNDEVVFEMGSRIDPENDVVRVDGVIVQMDTTKRYFVLNKPRGVVSTMNDENGRPDLREFVDPTGERLYNVGRLDTDTSGLLILTNDGDLAHKLAHPSFGVQKTYIAKVRGRLTPAVIQQLRDGIELADGPIHADAAKLLPGGTNKSHSLVEITLHSGRNRIVRRMLAEVGHPVEELVRRQFGPLNLGIQRVGEMRELSAAERGALLSAAAAGGTETAPTGVAVREAAVRDGKPRKPGKAGGAKGKGKSKTTGKNGAAGKIRGEDRGAGQGQSAKGNENGRGGRAGSGRSQPITAGRPGDGKGAKGMRGIAAKGNPHTR